MKKFSLIMLLIIFSAANLFSESADNSPKEKKKGEVNLRLYDLDGKKAGNVNEYAGKLVILNFWATWCPPCKAEMPSMEKLYKKYKDEGLEILAVSVDKAGSSIVKQFQKDNDYTFPMFHDSRKEASKKFRISSIPTTYIIDKKGKIVDTIRGSINWMRKDVISNIEKLLAE